VRKVAVAADHVPPSRASRVRPTAARIVRAARRTTAAQLTSPTAAVDTGRRWTARAPR